MYNTLLDTNVRNNFFLCIFCQFFICKTEFSVTFCISNSSYISRFYHTFYGCLSQAGTCSTWWKVEDIVRKYICDRLSKKVFAFRLSLTCSTTPSGFAFLLTWLVRVLTLSQRLNVVSSLQDIFERNIYYLFLCVVRYVHAKFIMYHTVTWCYVLQHWWYFRPKRQGGS